MYLFLKNLRLIGGKMKKYNKSKLTKRDKVAVFTVFLQVAVSLLINMVSIFKGEDFSLGKQLTLLSCNIVALVTTLEFAITRFFDDQEENLKELKEENISIKNAMQATLIATDQKMRSILDEMQGNNAVNEVCLMINRQNEYERNLYQKRLSDFLRELKTHIQEQRSGELDKATYYDALSSLADRVCADALDKKNYYHGEIWAMTFNIDGEWDDNDPYEKSWFSKMYLLDKNGIRTRRLWVFNHHAIDILNGSATEYEVDLLLKKLHLYCSKQSSFYNTESFAIAQDQISPEHLNVFGKGFFAAQFCNGELALIRGVSFDYLLSKNTLGGEIDFDENRIQNVRSCWENYVKIAQPLNKYLYQISSDDTKKRMRTMYFSEE